MAVLVSLDNFSRILEVFTIDMAVTLEHGVGFMASGGLDELTVQSYFAVIGHGSTLEVVKTRSL